MANIKSSKKRALQSKAQQLRNQSRRSEIKTLTKQLIDAIDSNDVQTAQVLARKAESKIARAKGKGLFRANTAARKVSKISKKVPRG